MCIFIYVCIYIYTNICIYMYVFVHVLVGSIQKLYKCPVTHTNSADSAGAAP